MTTAQPDSYRNPRPQLELENLHYRPKKPAIQAL